MGEVAGSNPALPIMAFSRVGATRRHWKRVKLKAMLSLGMKCAKCDISDFRVLQFDHKNNDGAAERGRNKSSHKNSYVMFKAIINGERTDIQLLCANCHMLKTFENSIVSDYDDIMEEFKEWDCGAVWLALRSDKAEVGGSNPLSPTRVDT
jgi:hypothetical protein